MSWHLPRKFDTSLQAERKFRKGARLHWKALRLEKLRKLLRILLCVLIKEKLLAAFEACSVPNPQVAESVAGYDALLNSDLDVEQYKAICKEIAEKLQRILSVGKPVKVDLPESFATAVIEAGGAAYSA